MKTKRIFSNLLFFCTCFFIIFTVNGYGATEKQEYAGNQLKQLGILKGYEDGSLGLDQPVTRAEMATIMVRTLGLADKKGELEPKSFDDVNQGHWANPYIQSAYQHKIVSGYTDGTYRPGNNITFQEVITMLVRAHGTKPTEDMKWPENYLNAAEKIKLISGDVDGTHIASRGEVAEHLWRVLLLNQ